MNDIRGLKVQDIMKGNLNNGLNILNPKSVFWILTLYLFAGCLLYTSILADLVYPLASQLVLFLA